MYCYMPVCELRSTSFSVIPVTSSSFRHVSVLPVTSPSPSSLCFTYRSLSSFIVSPSFVYSFVTDLFRPFYVPSIISWICGYAIIL